MSASNTRGPSGLVPSTRRTVRHMLLSLGLLGGWGCMTATADTEHRYEDVARVIAIGDIHGGYDEVVRLLTALALVDANGDWAAGATHLVSLGDLIDRGPRSRDVLDLMIRLQSQALETGGRVHVVLGNHELMNLTGDARYLTDIDWATYADDSQHPDRLRAQAALAEGETLDAPIGYFSWRDAFAADGRYGAWLLEQPAVVVVNDTLFVHGGASPLLAQLDTLAINARLHTALPAMLSRASTLQAHGQLPWDVSLLDLIDQSDTELARAVRDPIYGNNGPFWYRGNSWCPSIVESGSLQKVLAAFAVERVVVGHTPTATRRVTSRMNGRVIMLDTGMLASYYKGTPTALALTDGAIRVLNDRGEAVDMVTLYADINPHGWNDVALEDALTGEPAEVVDEATGLLQFGPVKARFTARSRNGVRNEVAAYRLDRQLGLGMVPVTVAYEHEGKRGIVQVEARRWYTEAERQAAGAGFSNWCAEPTGHPYRLVSTFDALIDNKARDAHTLSYDLTSNRLRLTGHDASFSRSKRIESFDDSRASPPLIQAMRNLTEANLTGFLSERQARALLERRDAIVESQEGP